MSGNHSSVQLCPVIKETIETEIEGAVAEVSGGGGHYRIRVVSSAFEGKSMLQKQRLVYRVIAPLMTGTDAPLHAVDELLTETPPA